MPMQEGNQQRTHRWLREGTQVETLLAVFLARRIVMVCLIGRLSMVRNLIVYISAQNYIPISVGKSYACVEIDSKAQIHKIR
jgi:hypothetical protein